jgi:hypothetical protein
MGRQGSADTLPCPDRSPRGGSRRHLENDAMNEYEVTYSNGEMVEIEAWTPEIAQTIAEEDVNLDGRSLSVVSVKLLTLGATEL